MTEKELQQMKDVATHIEKASQERLVKAANAMSAAEERNNLLARKNRCEKKYGNVIVVQHEDYQWGVINKDGTIVVPFGKYGWIDGFDSGLARVRSHGHSGRVGNAILIIQDLEKGDSIEGKDNIQRFLDEDRKINSDRYAKWGIINEKGEEVLPVEYDDVWNFYGKNRISTRVEKDGVKWDIFFHELNPDLPECDECRQSEDDYYNDYGTHYGEYAGTYAQDVAGFSDDVINDAFDGEPDAYWNID